MICHISVIWAHPYTTILLSFSSIFPVLPYIITRPIYCTVYNQHILENWDQLAGCHWSLHRWNTSPECEILTRKAHHLMFLLLILIMVFKYNLDFPFIWWLLVLSRLWQVFLNVLRKGLLFDTNRRYRYCLISTCNLPTCPSSELVYTSSEGKTNSDLSDESGVLFVLAETPESCNETDVTNFHDGRRREDGRNVKFSLFSELDSSTRMEQCSH